MPTASLVLPFAVPVKERVKAFTPSMEVAAILLLTEAKRKKRRLLEAMSQKTSFVSKLHYPLWAVPWENESLIVDGSGVFYSTTNSLVLPDITVFIDDIERGTSVREQFESALEKHEKTFKDFAKTDKIQMSALMMDEELLSTVVNYVKETHSLKLEGNGAVVLVPPKLDLQAAIESANQASSLHKQIQSEIRSLGYTRNLLEETAKFHEQMILKEVESTREAYEIEISKLRPAVERKVDLLLKERDARIAKMNRIMENELKAKERERERRERELQRLELGRANYLKRRETRKRRHDKIGITHWEHRIRVHENRIQEVKARIRALSEFIEKNRAQNEADTEKLRYGYQALIDQEKKKITDIEVQRDGSVEAKQKEIEKLRLAAGRIVSQIEELVERKGEQEKELRKLAIPWQFEDVTLLCLPFYLVCYQTEKKTQFQVFPPFKVVDSVGLVKILQKTIRSLRPASELKPFLQPRSKALSKMLDFVLEEKMSSDKAFSESLLQAASLGNILEMQNFRETLTRGVEELQSEGWIGPREGDALIKAYT